MDPVAHTLFGATLAETGLKKVSPLATPTLIIGANLPDIDGFAGMAGSDASLYWRRGWTHGVLAMVVLPLLLTGGMLLWDRWRRKDAEQRARAGPLLALSAVGVLSHPLLDWMNTYGVRLLMPFDGRWFYGDVLFIVEPWMWLLMAAAVVVARSAGRLSIAAWLVLGVATTALVLGVAMVPLATKIAWVVGVALILVVRLRLGAGDVPRLAIGCTVALALYIGGMLTGTGAARALAAEQLGPAEHVFAGPVPANPLKREGVVVTETHYRMFSVDWTREQALSEVARLALPEDDPRVRAALAEVPGFANWMRFPWYEVEPIEGGGHRVWIRDLRYALPEQTEGFGITVVELD